MSSLTQDFFISVDAPLCRGNGPKKRYLFPGHSNHNIVSGHNAADQAFGVAAVSAYQRTTPFTGSEPLETFSADGPRRIFFNPDGTAITPGNFSSTGGRVRYKPDLTAANAVACATPGFNPFYGTSAAAPHAGAIAALLMSGKQQVTLANLRYALINSALPAPSTWKEVPGYGIVMADRALRLLFPKIFKPSIAGVSLLLQ